MTKSEKELAAIYLSSCLDEMRIADINGDPVAKEKARADYKSYCKKLMDVLRGEFELFGLDHEKAVIKPIQDVLKITQVFYSQRVNGLPLEYPGKRR